MNDDTMDPGGAAPSQAASYWVTAFVLALLVAGGGMFLLLRPPSRVTEALRDDPLLAEGHIVYQDRCLSCHGLEGKGDGPIAVTLEGPAPGDLTDGQWKHGGSVEEIQRVIREGVKGTSMSGWGRWLGDEQLRGITAYTYFLAGEDYPPELRTPASGRRPEPGAGNAAERAPADRGGDG